MLQQEREFKAWGLTRLAVRNIIVFFLIVETLAIISLSKIIVEQQRLREDDRRELIDTKQRAADKIEQLKNEQIDAMKRMNEIIERQQKFERDIAEMNRRVHRIKR